MPKTLVWNDHRDAIILALRADGAAWERIARLLAVSRWAVIARGRLLGATAPPRRQPEPDDPLDPVREPLPAGHPTSWGAITAGTWLDNTQYPWPPLAQALPLAQDIAPDPDADHREAA